MWQNAMMLAAALSCWAASRPAMADPAPEQGLLCRRAIQQAEAGSVLPPHMLGAIAHVESGRRDPVTGRIDPWPWTINAEGRGNFFDSKADAIAFARQLQARGVRSFDVGCLQINMMHHPDAFSSLEEAFDPGANARYAVKFLNELREKTGSWETASAWYHSANPEQGIPYRGLVVEAMDQEAKLPPLSYAALSSLGQPAGGSIPMRSMPTTLGNIMIMGGGTSGAIMGHPYIRYAGTILSGMPATSGGTLGRGLDAYRMAPVAIVRARLIPTR